MPQIKTTRTGTPAQFPQPGHQPHPHPKPGLRYLELSDAELADKARRLARLNSEIVKHQIQINELKREQNQIISEINIGTSPGIVEVCSLCGLRHAGNCNA